MKIKEKCIEVLKTTKIVCEENKRKVTFINSSNISVTKMRVDGCQIIDGGKCDFLVFYDDKEHFIELKGSDINHAIKQLIRTIETLGSKDCKKRISYIISSRSPLSAAEIQVNRIKFRKKLNSDLIVKNRQYETLI